MLIRYKKDFKKIAMGLLSFMPEEKKGVQKLQQTMNEYEVNKNWHLYLWRDEDILGAVGIRIEDDTHVIVQHVTVNPSHRNMGIGKKMIRAIHTQLEKKYTLQADHLTEKFYKQCIQGNKKQPHSFK